MIENGNPVHGGASIEGAQLRTFRLTLTLTAAAVLAMNATPQELVPAPGTGLALIFEGMVINKPAGTAFAGIAAGEDLAVKYTDDSGDAVAQCEATGFLDQATRQTRWVRAHTASSADSAITPVEDAALVLHMLTGEITTGDSDLGIEIHYRVVKTAP